MQDEYSPSVSYEPSGAPQVTNATRGYSAGGASGAMAGGSGYTSAAKESTNPLDNMTAEQLKQEKEKRQTNLNTSKSNLEQVTQDSQKSVDEAYKTYTDEMAKIDEESAKTAQQLQDAYDKISGFEKEIDNQNNIISGLKTDLNSAKSRETTASTKIADLESQLSYLEGANGEENNLQEQIDKVNSAIESAKEEKEDAVREQEDINLKIEEAQEIIRQQEEEIEAVNKEIEEFKTKEAEILEKNTELQQYKASYEQAKTDKETNIEKAQNEITKAQEELDEVEARINIQQYQEDKKEYVAGFYNADAGVNLAKNALNVDGTVGLCLGGVSKTLKATYGVGIPLGSAYMAADYLRGNMAGSEELASHFVEVQVDRSELANLPAGAIVVWDNNQNGGGSNVSAAGRKHGHISIALGDGRESSDHIQNQIVNRDANFTVFYPVS